MTKYLLGYLAVAATMLVLDVIWLGFVAKPLYQQGIGHLMAEQPKLAAAGLFYVLYALGLMIFVVSPGGSTMPWEKTLWMGALFGLFCYATYDLSNLATLKNWPTGLAFIDMAWGSVLSAACAGAGKAAMDRFGTA
jgi:uncharacterized membrane protein